MNRWICGVLILVACQLREEGLERSAPFKAGSLRIHLAEDAPADGLRAMTVPQLGGTVYVHPQPVLSEAHLRRIAVWRGEHGDHILALMFTEDGTAQLARVTTANIGKRLAFVIDGRVVTAPVIQTVITEGEAVIESGYTEEEAKRLLKELAGDARIEN